MNVLSRAAFRRELAWALDLHDAAFEGPLLGDESPLDALSQGLLVAVVERLGVTLPLRGLLRACSFDDLYKLYVGAVVNDALET